MDQSNAPPPTVPADTSRFSGSPAVATWIIGLTVMRRRITVTSAELVWGPLVAVTRTRTKLPSSWVAVGAVYFPFASIAPTGEVSPRMLLTSHFKPATEGSVVN
ncbi:hypothetical protein D3C81_1765100 [compost metagenome]